MANELKVGDRRHGALFDENPDTPDISATIERSEEGIYVSMFWDSEKNPEYARWFTNDVFYTDQDSNQVMPDPECPSALVFRDSHGPITLLGCRSDGYHTNLFIGTGKISVGAAVVGASNLTYSKIHGLRCEVAGLRSWLGKTSIQQTPKPDEETGKPGISIILSAPDPIKIPNSGLTLRPTFWKSRTTHSLEIKDLVHLEHRTEKESSWSTHFGALRAVRDLLAISRWRSEALIAEQVMRLDEPVPGLTATIEGVAANTRPAEQWMATIDNTSNSALEDSLRHTHLVMYEELGPEGISRWIKLREDFSRAIDPAISSIYLENLTVEVRLTQVAIALEALGYLIAVRDDGQSAQVANRMNIKKRLERIAQDLDGVLPFVITNPDWSQNIADAYNALKHVNRVTPQAVDVANAWRECVLLFRAWMASELGVDHIELTKRIRLDRFMYPYSAVDAL